MLKDIGEMQIALDYYRSLVSKTIKQLQLSNIMHNIEMPLCLVSGIVTGIGIVELCNGNKNLGKILTLGGGIVFISIELTYQSGHWIFKKW